MLQRYLQEVLGVEVELVRWEGAVGLPFFLTNLYDFFSCTLLNQPVLLMVAKEGVASSPGSVEKHRDQVMKVWQGPCVYVQDALEAHNRSRLIKKRIPFICPMNQMFLPDLGIDLREYFHRQQKTATQISAPTQALMIAVLTGELPLHFSLSEAARVLGYSRMTMSRAFDELDELDGIGVGSSEKSSRSRYWHYQHGRRRLWEEIGKHLSSPVKQEKWLKTAHRGILCGFSALSHYSMLAEPLIPEYAIDRKMWKQWELEGIKEVPLAEEADCKVEIWTYDPGLVARDGCVDPFSLFLSLQTVTDERVEMALDEMMEHITWSED